MAEDRYDLAKTLPPGVEIHFDLQVINIMQELAKKGEPRRQRLESAYREVVASLGHPPNLLELHRWGRYDVRLYRQEYGSWYAFLRTQKALTPDEIQLEKTA